MRRTAAHLKDLGFSVRECQLPGGIPNNNSIEVVQNFLNEKASEQDTAVVFDLFGNFSFRFEQADGNMALPIWLGGKPHLLGKVGVCGEKPFKDLIAKLLPLLNTNTNQPKIVLPPILRYISRGCCQDATHAGNATEDNHAVTMIGQAQVARLRKVLRGELAGSALVNYWVPDILEDLAPTSAGGSAGVEESAFELINLFTGRNMANKFTLEFFGNTILEQHKNLIENLTGGGTN